MIDINTFSDGHTVHAPAVIVPTPETAPDFAMGIRVSVETPDGQRLGRFTSEADAAKFIGEQGYVEFSTPVMAMYRKAAEKRARKRKPK